MKKILLMVLLTIFVRLELYAQCPCIANPGMDGSSVGWGNAINATLPSWWVLSGTPTLAQGVVGSSGVHISNGDGIATCYDFHAGSKYKICFRSYTTNGLNGTVRLQAHDGGTGRQTRSVSVTKHGLAPEDYLDTFTATSNFTQLRIFIDTINTSVVIDDVGITEIPTISASQTTINNCGTTTLTVAANSIGNMAINWSPTTGLTSPANRAQVTASPCKTTTYTASYSSGCQMFTCTNGTVQITINVLRDSIINNTSHLCGAPIDLQYNAHCSGNTYRWTGPKNPGNVLSTGPNLYMPTTTTNDVGTYILIVTPQNGCADTLYTTVSMNCCKTVADFNVVDCNPVRFENTTIDSIGGSTTIQGDWYWDFGDGTTSSIRNPSHTFDPQFPQTYNVCLTTVISDGFATCCNKVCKDVSTCYLYTCNPKAAFGFKILNPVTGKTQLIDKSVGAVGGMYFCGWTWKVDGTPYPGTTTQNPIINSLSHGTHNICLRVELCQPSGGSCFEEWCEDIFIP